MDHSLPSIGLLLRTLLVLLCVRHASADYAPCSDPSTCSGASGSCCTAEQLNGGATTYYCCPGSGNSLDANMMCTNYAQCGQSAVTSTASGAPSCCSVQCVTEERLVLIMTVLCGLYDFAQPSRPTA